MTRLNKPAVRRSMRRARRNLGPGLQTRAAERLLQLLSPHPLLRSSSRIALYLPQDGELDPRPLARQLWQRRQQVFLPVIEPVRGASPRLRFAPWTSSTRLQPNRFRIPEPLTPTYPGWSLDLVLMPLVAFDRQGNRLGMGGGFYDRTFDQLRPWPRQPGLIGLAHSLQEMPELPAAPHDVPLHAVVTDREFIQIASAPGHHHARNWR